MRKFAFHFRSVLAALLVVLMVGILTLNSQTLFARAVPQGHVLILPPAQNRNFAERHDFDETTFADQKIKSENFLLQNLNLPGIRAGIVVASPNRVAPNYFYHWVRDAAISFMQVQNFYLTDAGPARQGLQTWMLAHLSLNLGLQQLPNLEAGDGEPKFNVDGGAFQGPWGRPQTDGPALRAISFIYFLNLVTKENWSNRAQVAATLYDSKLPTRSLIKTDLEYIANHWSQPSFDLWEEAYGAHFFTLVVQRRALIEGAALAKVFGDSGAAQFYALQAAQIALVLEKFWNTNTNYIITAVNVQSGPRKPSLLDSSVLLAALYGDVGDGFYAPYDDRVLATLQVLKDTFQKEYSINQNAGGVALGRYPEDTYDGVNTSGIGNPWFISTQASAEVYYRTTMHLSQVKQIQINAINLHFYNSLMSGQMSFTVGQAFTPASPVFTQIVQAMFRAGDLQLSQTISHRGADGSLAEQINRTSGRMQGAANLTWSHASYLSAMTWRSYMRGSIR